MNIDLVLPYMMGGAVSICLYFESKVKGAKDLLKGKDTFFSRALVPALNKYLEKVGKNSVKDEDDFHNLLGEIGEINSKLENIARGW